MPSFTNAKAREDGGEYVLTDVSSSHEAQRESCFTQLNRPEVHRETLTDRIFKPHECRTSQLKRLCLAKTTKQGSATHKQEPVQCTHLPLVGGPCGALGRRAADSQQVSHSLFKLRDPLSPSSAGCGHGSKL